MLDKPGDTSRLKRRLLREAVQENVDIVQGNWPRRNDRKSRRWPWWTASLALVPVLVLIGSTRTPARDAPPASTPLPSTALPGLPAATIPVSALSSDPRLQAPRSIDPAVFPLPVRRVIIDPGHGGRNRGTVSPRGLLEKDLTLDIGMRLGLLLQEAGYEIVLTRHGDDNVSLAERTEIANGAAADAFVSIHVNWFTTRQSRAIETYYLGGTEDPELNRLAAAENGDSGYSLTDFKRLLEGVYAGVRQEESRRLAEEVDGALFRSLRVVNPALTDRGVKTAPFVVLIGTAMPAVLAEVSCLSNDKEAELLSDENYRQRIALALFAGVRAFADRPGAGPAPDARLAEKTSIQKGS